MKWLLCLAMPHRPTLRYTYVTLTYPNGSSQTAERPVRYCSRCHRVLEVLDA